MGATDRAVVDLGGRGDIHDLVVRFYREIVFDDLLAPMFGEVAEVDWAEHIPKLIDFWSRVLLGDPSYSGVLLAAHRHVHELEAFRLEHFDRWYLLWTQAIDESWAGPVAEQAKSHAARVGASLSRQLLGVTWQPGEPAEPRPPLERTPPMTAAAYTLPDLSYDPGALEPHISARITELHHDKHHAAYVTGANTALDRLADARDKGDFSAISMLEKNLAFHVSGHVLHSVFWTNLSPNGGGPPEGALAELLDATFGSVPAFRQQMTEAAATIQGSGWALASWEPIAGRLVVQQVHDHQGNHGQGTVPLLAIDAWEHAYYLQYENRKTDFFEAFWKVVNWDDVARRLADARGE